jgi:hypothetical protein
MRWLLTGVGIMAMGMNANADVMVRRAENVFVVTGPAYAAEFSEENGAILAVRQAGKPGYLFKSGAQGLWRVRFRNGKEIRAADFRADSTERSFRCEADAKAGTLRMAYRSAEIAVSVTVTGRSDGLDFRGEVEPASEVALDFELPARLRFDAAQVERFVCPVDGNQGVGAAFKRAFFLPQPEERPTAWRQEIVGPQGYAALYGGPLAQRADQDPPVALHVTPEGAQWLGEAAARRLEGAQATVNRPPTRAQAQITLVDSPNGPWLSANRLGGSGALWRIGGAVGETEKGNALEAVAAVVERLAQSAPDGRKKIGVLAMQNGPEQGGWAGVRVRDWAQRFRRIQGTQLVELTTIPEMAAALQADDFLVLLNPYGEWTPTLPEGMLATVEAIGRYVRAGGNWFETGGYPFFYALRPARHFAFSGRYPAMFADFLHLDSHAGSVSVYRVQPQTAAPWAGAKDRQAIFVPGSLGCGSDEEGGYCDRAYATYVNPGETWRAPLTRMTTGKTAEADLRAYCADNAIRRRLDEKMSKETLEKFKRSVLVYYGGSARDKTQYLDLLPSPSLIHFADYLKGGFDKQYPDHLPPNPAFGTPEEFRAFFDHAHALGHLVMPYTNPTWWCDHPKGPTFEREGEAPLLKTLDGKPQYERYGQNDGWTVCHWHPAVQAANRLTVRRFTQDYPVDVLFQDQCGARTWAYDTNPASPTPYAYTDGLISMVEEDCKTKPLSTESGWDRVVNWESQICGLSWALVPTEYGPEWRRLMKFTYPPDTWDVFPLAQYIAHERTAMLYHDLGQFVTNREVLSWTLGLGFCMSARIGAAELKEDGAREWLRWLDRLQKSVCARYVGEPVRAFAHDRGPNPTTADDGVMRAVYGPVRVAANLGPAARSEEGRELPPHGFYAAAPGMVAANLQRLGGTDFGAEGVSFVTEGGAKRADVWVYARESQEVCVQLPARVSGTAALTFDGGASAQGAAKEGVLRFRLPARAGDALYLWHATARW